MRPDDYRSVKIASWRRPSTSAPPATGRLLKSPNHRPLIGAGACEMLCLIVGAAKRVVTDHSVGRGKPRRQTRHRTKRADAAASAPPTIGPGNRKKNKVTTAVTNSTPLSSVVIG